jgi:two-component system, NarL family, response regulator NreC
MSAIKILLVDDHQIVLDGLRALLAAQENIACILEATSAEKALEIIAQEPIDVVVLDISMPNGMDGITATKKIRREYKDIKVILLTMIGEADYMLNAMKSGAHGYIIKEKSKEALTSAIHAVMANNRYFPSEVWKRIEEKGLNPYADIVEEEREVQLTKREKEILCLMNKYPGYTAKEVAKHFNLAATTVERHTQNMREKLGYHTNRELLIYAREKLSCSEEK